ncbi:MAG: hypothetical protein OXC44_02465 [Proteobacteria bacterium]|nr:hypothetical protein [Pseudomonadota bacterium]
MSVYHVMILCSMAMIASCSNTTAKIDFSTMGMEQEKPLTYSQLMDSSHKVAGGVDSGDLELCFVTTLKVCEIADQLQPTTYPFAEASSVKTLLNPLGGLCKRMIVEGLERWASGGRGVSQCLEELTSLEKI